MASAERILYGVHRSIMEYMNRELTEEYKMEEIVLALKNMGQTKAANVDDFPVGFYQKFWHVMGMDVRKFYQQMLNEGKYLESINSTLIVLIPKNA